MAGYDTSIYDPPRSPYSIATAGQPISASNLGPPASSAKLDPFGYEIPSRGSELLVRSEARVTDTRTSPYSSATLSPPADSGMPKFSNSSYGLSPPETAQSIVTPLPPPSQPSFVGQTQIGGRTELPQQSSFAWSTSGLGGTSQVDGRPLTTQASPQYGSTPAIGSTPGFGGATVSFGGTPSLAAAPGPAFSSAPAMFGTTSAKPGGGSGFWGDVYRTGPTEASSSPDYVKNLAQSRISTEAPSYPSLAQKVQGADEDNDGEDDDEGNAIYVADKTTEMAFGTKIDAQTTYYLGGYAQNHFPGQGDPREELYVAVKKDLNSATYRVEPAWMDGAWYLTAPVDFKGIENHPDRQYEQLNAVDEAVRQLDEKNQLPPLPPPRHWKEQKSCPIA